MIVGGADSSRGLFITEEEEPEGGTTLLYASAPILYIAPASIPDTLLKVQVIAAAWEVIWGKRGEVKGQAPGIQLLSRKQADGQRGTALEGNKVAEVKADLVKRDEAAALKMALLASWCPINEVVVKNAAPTLTLNIPEPREVWPTLREKFEGNAGDRNIKKMITVSVTRDGISLSNYAVTIAAKMMLPSGGHDHANQPPQNLLGEFKDTRTKATGKGTITTVTDEDGLIRVDFTAPEFSGKLEIKATSTAEKAEDKKELVVKVPNLVEFGGTGEYELSGALEGKHMKNHFFCSQKAIDELVKAAGQFRKAKWNNAGKMRLNDMSLEWGGLFDKDANWKPPHSSHRVGRSVDIENILLKDTTATFTIKGKEVTKTVRVANEDWLEKYKKLMTERNWDFVDEGQTVPNQQGRVLFPHFEWKGN